MAAISSEQDFPYADKPVTTTCTCACGAVWRSHARYIKRFDNLIALDACPACGRNDALRSIRSDPERWTIGG